MQLAASQHTITIANGGTTSNTLPLRDGTFGTIIVPSGSPLIGKTWNLYATPTVGGLSFTDAALLTASAFPKTFAAGANPFTADEIAQIGAVQDAKIVLGSAVSGDSTAVLLWKR